MTCGCSLCSVGYGGGSLSCVVWLLEVCRMVAWYMRGDDCFVWKFYCNRTGMGYFMFSTSNIPEIK